MTQVDPFHLPPAAEGVCLAICHDLRAPLATAAAAVRELGRGPALDEPMRRYLEIAGDCLSKADELLRALPDLLAADAPSDAPVDLSRIVEAVCDDVRLDLELCGGRLRVVGALPTVLGEPARLRIALRNLVRNAVRYRRDDVRLEIVIRAWNRPRASTLTIADNGLGIGHATTHPDGLGIGLAIAQRAIESSGGRLELASRRGPGTIAAVTLRPAVGGRRVRDRTT